MPIMMGIAALLLVSLGITIPFDPSWWQVVILGIVQGLTEFLPISSTAHLLITSDLIGFNNSIGGTFEIAIQLGTVVAVMAFYFQELFGQAKALLGQSSREENATAR
ncbi:MAG: undecaprenyl-diphosphatase, partial [Oscillochloris sp.]|nr:undecaprenyl-diphosphatase [Oscillochloris sp.]